MYRASVACEQGVCSATIVRGGPGVRAETTANVGHMFVSRHQTHQLMRCDRSLDVPGPTADILATLVWDTWDSATYHWPCRWEGEK